MGSKTSLAAAAGALVLLAGCSSGAKTSAQSPSVSPSVTVSSPVASPSDSGSVSATPTPTPSETASAGSTDYASMTGPELIQEASKAMIAAGSVKAAGTGNLVGGPVSGKFTIVLSNDGVQMQVPLKGQQVAFVWTKGGTYIKGPAALWTSEKVPAAFATKLAGKWIKLPASSAGSEITLSALAKHLGDPNKGAKILSEVTTSTYNGKPVYVLKQSDGSTLFIAADGPPLPVHAVDKGSEKSVVDFYDYGKPNAIVAPAGAVDLATLLKP